MCVLILMVLFLIPVQASYDPNVDYMASALDQIAAGDLATAKESMEKRNEKIADMGLDYKLVDAEELWLLSKIIYAEAGSYWLTDEHQRMVGSVVLNRMASPEFPDTMREVLEQPGQYYGENNSYFENLLPSERAVKNALYLLEHGSIAPPEVVFQANFPQGSGTYMVIWDQYLGGSWFCYSSNMELYQGQ